MEYEPYKSELHHLLLTQYTVNCTVIATLFEFSL